MNIKTAIFALGGIILIGVVVFFVMSTDPNDINGDNGDGDVVEHDMIRVETPRSGAVIESPLHVTGEARGMWFFEASFPVSLILEDGTVVAQHYAMTAEEWMTEDFVSFTSDITFSHPGAGNGWLVLERSNPSGLSEHADEIRIPVRFSAVETREVSVYFNREGVAECGDVVAVSRSIPRTQAVARAALEQLLSGTTASEHEQGFRTAINPGVTIQQLSVQDGVATADFSSEIEAGVGGSCLVSAIRGQIEDTLLQFPTVESVVISVDGRTEDILQP